MTMRATPGLSLTISRMLSFRRGCNAYIVIVCCIFAVLHQLRSATKGSQTYASYFTVILEEVAASSTNHVENHTGLLIEKSPAESILLSLVPSLKNLETGSSESIAIPVKNLTFYMLPLPEMTDWLIGNYTEIAEQYYANTLNENAAEIWSHRGFLNTTHLVADPTKADVILVPSYLHLAFHIKSTIKTATQRMVHVDVRSQLADLIMQRIDEFYDPSQHRIVTMMTSQNPTEARQVGVRPILETLRKRFGDNLFSLGFERNEYWQSVSAEQIIVIPYVVKPVNRSTEHVFQYRKQGIFYRGDRRPNAVGWAGCNRSMVAPLMAYARTSPNPESINVELVAKGSRISQADYNAMVEHSEFCLAVCGDTVTSRSLASYMIAGCIPIRIGSRLRGYCDKPCKHGWGWSVTNGSSHLPYPSIIDWNKFPEIDEQRFTDDPVKELRSVLNMTTSARRQELRRIMQQSHRGFVYGWGNPVDSMDYGEAFKFIRQSIVNHLSQRSPQ